MASYGEKKGLRLHATIISASAGKINVVVGGVVAVSSNAMR